MPAELLSLREAQGRITARAIWARTSSPHYNAAAMDGAAVRARETIGATETNPLALKLATQAVWVDTGDPMPIGFDAVVMIENLQQIDDCTIGITSAVAPWQHVRPLGEDIIATELVLPENHRITPVDLGACAAAGLTELPVRRLPKVAILPTGNELVPVGTDLKPGDVVEFNSLILSGLVQEWGGHPVTLGAVPDQHDIIQDAAQQALENCDVLVINAGSSAGSEDHTASVVEKLGTLVVHGIAIRPGHPVVLGYSGNKPIIGLPGYPVSAVLTAELMLKPLLESKLGLPGNSRRPRINASITRKVLSPIGEDEFLRVKLGKVGEKMAATPVQRGAGVIMSLVRADGIVRIPRFSEGMDAGTEVSVELLRPIEEIQNTIVCTGSHDMVLDLIASHLGRKRTGVSLSSSHVGSLGGLTALRRGDAHLAGSHLLDETTGEYNISYIRRYLPGVPIMLVKFVGRVQGLMVSPGNPQGIQSLADLTQPEITFVNRQRGSGTRVLLDYKLKELNIPLEQINGYQREEYTHLAVAAAVQSGSADTGLGVLSAARALGLDFIPLLNEQYDLVILRTYYESGLLQPMLSLLQDSVFQNEVESLGGYDISGMGSIIAEIS